jgi:hypothetical protein
VTISCSIQLPEKSRAAPTPMALGTNESVASWICVTDWNSEIAKPISSAVSSTGAHIFAATVMACMPNSTIIVSVMQASSGPGGMPGVREGRASVAVRFGRSEPSSTRFRPPGMMISI